MIFFGAASALKKLVAKHYPGDIGRQNTNNCWLVGMGSLVAVAFALGRGTSELTAGFNMGSVPLRTVNALSTAAALLVGGSILCPTEKLWNSQPTAIGHRPTERVRDALIILALTGITGCYSTLSLRRSFTSWYQLCCFLVAVLCVCGKDVYDAIWNRNKHSSDDGGSYDLVSHSSGTRAEDREESGVADRIHRKEYRGYSLRSSLVSVALIMLWTAYISFNFGQRPYPRINTLLDQEYKPAVSLDVVVSMYKERTEDVAALISKLESMPQMSDAHIIIYLKDGKADERRIKEETNAHEVIKLPNVGREAETYLNHIVTRWDRLAERTVFLQADVHNPREFYPFFSRYFDRNRTGFLNLGWAGNVCNTERCGDMFGWEDETSFISQLQSQIYNSTSENVLLSYKGQFVVTAARIRGINKATYEELRQYLTDANSWTHQQEYLQGRPESMSQPYFGYTLERIWNVLFQCSDMNIAWKCPTLLSGWRPGGSIADCQCFDTEPDS
ncbi:hypothetical protein BDW02DRAFT_496193 [Decorospora gaudefroyi]|uniref:Uncharacterized protein n=1 Tax=Decorospora gaudefroyi TaxID=184978 RepID=A0A6A5KP60_9PLEO|nr:hypothetical protein BDW02DRAFT_496193 [Decorospora gaudefroyi]